ncbi:hypothetical protein H0W91_01680 [Patescibacteria group bacterium]|nr:hypothetical protein [Patescibacteria group bacterium]
MINNIKNFQKGECVIDGQRVALVEKIKDVLRQGQRIAVLGWRDSNHNKYTRQLMDNGRIIFRHKIQSDLGGKVGLVILTKFIGHDDFERVRVLRETFPIVVSNGEIKRILFTCLGVQTLPNVLRNATPERKPVPTPPAEVSKVSESQLLDQEMVEVVEQIIPATEAPVEKPSMITVMEVFAKKFISESLSKKEERLTKYEVSALRREFGIKMSAHELIKEGWIEPFVSEGSKNAGSYKATEKMLALAGSLPSESSDPLVRARRLVESKDQIEGDIIRGEEEFTRLKQEHEERLTELHLKLEQVKQAGALLAQLEALMK